MYLFCCSNFQIHKLKSLQFDDRRFNSSRWTGRIQRFYLRLLPVRCALSVGRITRLVFLSLTCARISYTVNNNSLGRLFTFIVLIRQSHRVLIVFNSLAASKTVSPFQHIFFRTSSSSCLSTQVKVYLDPPISISSALAPARHCFPLFLPPTSHFSNSRFISSFSFSSPRICLFPLVPFISLTVCCSSSYFYISILVKPLFLRLNKIVWTLSFECNWSFLKC